MHFIGIKRILYWVIGGKFPSMLNRGILPINPYREIPLILVEGNGMRSDLSRLGLTQAITVPNVKEIPIIPFLPKHESQDTFHFVFLSRIMPQKGCELIFEAVEKMKNTSHRDFDVTFFGPIDPSYSKQFFSRIQQNPKCKYDGFLNLDESCNYEKLASYDAMLFPTSWDGEGFPGVILDAYIAGLPVLASRWNMNEELIKEGRTGLLYSPQDANELQKAMERIIQMDTADLRQACRQEAMKYDACHVLTEEFFSNLIERTIVKDF